MTILLESVILVLQVKFKLQILNSKAYVILWNKMISNEHAN